MKLTGYIVCSKIYLFIYVTWDDGVTSRDNYIMPVKTSWIRFFQNVRKSPKITEKCSKSMKRCKKKKNLKEVKIIELKFIFTTVFAYAKRELRNGWRFEAILPLLLHSIRCKQKAVDRWLADLHVTPLSV